MLRFRLWVELLDEDGGVVQEMSCSATTDNLPRSGDLITPMNDIDGPAELTGWGGPGTVAFETHRKILKMPDADLVVKCVKHDLQLDWDSSRFRSFQTDTTVVVQMAHPGADVMGELESLVQGNPWTVHDLGDPD